VFSMLLALSVSRIKLCQPSTTSIEKNSTYAGTLMRKVEANLNPFPTLKSSSHRFIDLLRALEINRLGCSASS
jgi:hypothetical protein